MISGIVSLEVVYQIGKEERGVRVTLRCILGIGVDVFLTRFSFMFNIT